MKNVIFLCLVILFSCNGKKTGIEGDNNDNNRIVIADKIDKVDNSTKVVINNEQGFLKTIPLNFFDDIYLNTPLGFIKQKFGEPNEVEIDTIDNGKIEKEYSWDLENGTLSVFVYDNNEMISGIDISLNKKSLKRGQIDFNGVITNKKNYHLPFLGIMTFRDLLKYPDIANKAKFRFRKGGEIITKNFISSNIFTVSIDDDHSFYIFNDYCCYEDKVKVENFIDSIITHISITDKQFE